jgi:hypothetical protein
MARVLESLRSYARHRKAEALPGATLSSVQAAVRAKRIPTVCADGKTLIDRAVADAAWAKNTDGAQSRRATRRGVGAPVGLDTERQRLLKLRGDKLQRELAGVNAGGVVPVDLVIERLEWARLALEAAIGRVADETSLALMPEFGLDEVAQKKLAIRIEQTLRARLREVLLVRLET